VEPYELDELRKIHQRLGEFIEGLEEKKKYFEVIEESDETYRQKR